MKNNWLNFVPESIQNLTPYQPGKPIETLERELGIRNSIKLASNENPLGPSPKVCEAMQKNLSQVARYPDGDAFFLKEALSQYHQRDRDWFTIGSGSDELFRIFGQAFLAKDAAILVSEYCFASYILTARSFQADVQVVPTKDWQTDIAGLIAAANDKTRLLMLANPNNPTGTWCTHAEIKNLLSNIPKHVVVVLDEAYCDYNDEADYPDALVLQNEFPNLIITRTFSKAYGLGGLRVGYAIANPDFGDIFNRIRMPFNVNIQAQTAALAALADREHIAASVALNREQMSVLSQAITSLGLEHIPSLGNFLTVAFPGQAQAVYEALLKQGVIVRPLANYKMVDHLRITVGLASENDRLVTALSSILA